MLRKLSAGAAAEGKAAAAARRGAELALAARNNPRLSSTDVRGLSVVDVLLRDAIVLTEEAQHQG